jgi:hypothetical protein
MPYGSVSVFYLAWLDVAHCPAPTSAGQAESAGHSVWVPSGQTIQARENSRFSPFTRIGSALASSELLNDASDGVQPIGRGFGVGSEEFVSMRRQLR